MEPSIVYVKTDKQNRIIAVDGGYTTPTDLSGWVKIDEGYGDKYNLCQSNYLPKPLYADGGVPQYKLIDGKVTESSEEEIELDRLPLLQQSKLAELSNACNATINAGTQVQLSDGSTESFTYGLVDQSNISEMFNAVLLGATEYPYHANDDDCRMYSAQDIMTIYVTLSSYKTAQTTYHNQLKQYVKAMESATEVEAVTYGQELTGIYLDKYNELMAQAKAQLDNIVAKVQSNEMA